MKKIPKANYPTREDIAERIKARECEASRLPPGPARQSILIEVAKLRAYAEVKRWLRSN
ncbi:hypothetical protein [Bradyrhizobium sp. LHD-71]|uniref:hypothetical protein n=1 Tax=Bradyrhizobium sp. LHD-71 TaxID=3072141 RepID=UPI00280CAD55|nr:hypothetical protein [Bradyrhizobium sp. LHD-71]MDQ8729181.1 hypothetical protein [Bradyrhizobium sp. LHD-71]